MCFKPPKPPKPVPNPEFTIQRNEAEQMARDTRAANKQARLEQTMQMLSGRVGRVSMFTGSAGGAGFAAPAGRSLFVKG